MTGTTSKSKLRIEKKKKKMAALLDIVKLNEYDRAQKNKLSVKLVKTVFPQTETQPSPNKRLKTEEKSDDVEKNLSAERIPPLIGELGPSGKPKLEGEEYIRLKKMLRNKTEKVRQQPQFKLRELGENASLKVNIDDRIPMFLSDLQHLLMYSQIGAHSPYSPARWCGVDKYNRLVNTNLIIIENISLYDFITNESQFPFLNSMFDIKLEMITPASYQSNIVKDLSMVPLTGTQMKKFKNNFGDLETAVIKSNEIFDTIRNFFPIEEKEDQDTSMSCDKNLPATDKFPRTQLLLSGWQMVEENFPLPIHGLMERKYSGYVLTKDKYKDVTPFSPMIAIDCEMCRTSTGDLELTRVSAVDEHHNVFYDTLVKPDNKIVDYLTKWSGINSKMMKGVTTKLKDVQVDIRRLLPEDAILIGQSLANDMHALKMMHPYIIDTSVIYNVTGDRSRKTKLQTLAREFLMEKIQVGHQGHCSSEDSLACMKLVQHRLKKNLYYGDAVMGNVHNDFRTYPDMGTSNYATSMLRQCVKINKKVSVIGLDEIAQMYKFYVDKGKQEETENIHCISAKSNKDIIRRYCESLQNNNLNIAHLKITEHQHEDVDSKIFRVIDKWVKDVYEQTSNSSLVAVLFGGREKSNGVCFLQLKREFI